MGEKENIFEMHTNKIVSHIEIMALAQRCITRNIIPFGYMNLLFAYYFCSVILNLANHNGVLESKNMDKEKKRIYTQRNMDYWKHERTHS